MRFIATANVVTIDRDGWSSSFQLPAWEFSAPSMEWARMIADNYYRRMTDVADFVDHRFYVDVQGV